VTSGKQRCCASSINAAPWCSTRLSTVSGSATKQLRAVCASAVAPANATSTTDLFDKTPRGDAKRRGAMSCHVLHMMAPRSPVDSHPRCLPDAFASVNRGVSEVASQGNARGRKRSVCHRRPPCYNNVHHLFEQQRPHKHRLMPGRLPSACVTINGHHPYTVK